MGTFDYINMRLNGYDFHKSLMAGTVMDRHQGEERLRHLARGHALLPEGCARRTWRRPAEPAAARRRGWRLRTPHRNPVPQNERDDIDFFAFPEMDPQYAQDAVKRPSTASESPKKSKNLDGAMALLKWLGTPTAENTYLSTPTTWPSTTGPTTKYSALQKVAASSSRC